MKAFANAYLLFYNFTPLRVGSNSPEVGTDFFLKSPHPRGRNFFESPHPRGDFMVKNR